MSGTKHGQRHGDPWGRSELRITQFRARQIQRNPGAALVSWIGALDAKGTWYKVFRDTIQVAVTRAQELIVPLIPGDQHFLEVIDVGPLSGDPSYDISFAVTVIPGNKVLLTWDRTADFVAYAIYWDNASGTVDLVTPFRVQNDNPTTTQQKLLTPELAPGIYKFVIRSRDLAGNESTNINEHTAVIAPRRKPPTNLQLTYDSGTKKATLTWTDPISLPGGSKIRVYQGENTLSGEWDVDIGKFADVDYTTIVASVNPAVETFVSAVLGLGRIHTFALRTFDGTDEEKNVDVRIRLELSSANDNRTLRPARAEDTDAEAIAAGKIKITAFIPAREGHAVPISATVFQDTVLADLLAGLGTGNSASLTKVDRGHRVDFTSGVLADGQKFFFIVRGSGVGSATGLFDADDVVDATADSTVPAAPASQVATVTRGGTG